MLVADIIKDKDDRLVSVRPNMTISEVAHILRQQLVGAALVSSKDNELLGIISERDIVFGLDQHGQSITEMHCSELMTSPVKTCTTQTGTEDLMKRMLDEKIRHLPVVDDGKLLGIVSIGDVVKSVVTELKWMKDVLEQQVIRSAAWATEED